MNIESLNIKIISVVSIVGAVLGVLFFMEKRIEAAVITKVEKVIYEKDMKHLTEKVKLQTDFIEKRLVEKTTMIRTDINDLKDLIKEGEKN